MKKSSLTLLLGLILLIISPIIATASTTSVINNGSNIDLIKFVASDFPITDVDSGLSYSLSDFIGRIVVLDLFATWCTPCEISIPYLRQLYSTYSRSELQIISIDVDYTESQSAVSQFRQNNNMDWIVGIDFDTYINSRYGSDSVPEFYIIDSNGYIQWTDVGFSAAETWPVMSSTIATLVEDLGGPAQPLSPAAKVFLIIGEVVGGLGAAAAIIYGIYKLRARIMQRKCLTCKNAAKVKCTKCGSFVCTNCSSFGCPKCKSGKFIRI